jgi:antirestriction protein ArdC
MTKRTRTQQDQDQWQAQRDERMSTLMQQLEAGVEAIQTSEDFKRYLRTAAIFHAYSPNNVLLILSQRPDATRVAGYKTWQALGRQVKKGEKAISIFAPRPYRVTTEDETGEEQSRLAQDHVGAGDVGGCAGSGLHHGAGQMLRHLHPLVGA